MSAPDHWRCPPVATFDAGDAELLRRLGVERNPPAVPPLPTLKPRQRVRVVDANHRDNLRWCGRPGRIYSVAPPGQPLRFVADGDYRTHPIDSPLRPGNPEALIVEPLEP